MKDVYVRILQGFGIFIGLALVWIVVSSSYTIHVKRSAQQDYLTKKRVVVTLYGTFTGEWERVPSAIMAALTGLGYDDVQQHPPPENSPFRREIWSNKTGSPRAVQQGLPIYVNFRLNRKDKRATRIDYALRLLSKEREDGTFHDLDDVYQSEKLPEYLQERLTAEFQRAGIPTSPDQFQIRDRERKVP